MTRHAQPMSENARNMAAVDWFVRRGGGALPHNEEEAFQAWLAKAPENREAYAALERIWSKTAAVENEPVVEVRRSAMARAADGTRRRRRVLVAGLAVLCVGFTAATLSWLSIPRSLTDQSFRTAVGQQATITLRDGSVVTLNTDTVLRTHADRERRLVYLDRGQAFFRVAKDRRHPFVVSAAGRTVTAIGTAFDVRVDGGELKVVLVEGKVRVESLATVPLANTAGTQGASLAPARSETMQATEMSAGSQLVAPDDADWRLTRTNVARETSWLQGQIVFDDKPLGDIVAELNRYSTRKIVIADEDLARRRLSGIYKPGRLDSFSHALREFGVADVKQEANGDIRVVPLQ